MAVDVNFLQVIWFILITVVLIGYYVLDGFDLGVGALYPFISKNDKDKRVLRNIVGPVWDGNEVWLLTAGGALFAAFPPAYATTFSGFYLAIMLVLFSLILRAVAIHFCGHAEAFSGFWHFAFFIGSALPALLFGVAVGNLLNTVPLLPNGDIAGAFPARFIQLLGVFPLICGLLSLFMALTHGAAWIALKAHPSPLRERASKLRGIFGVISLVLFVVGTAVYYLMVVPQLPEVGTHYLIAGIPTYIRYAACAIAVIAALGVIVWSKQAKDLLAFLASGVFIAFTIIVFAATMFPSLVPAGQPVMALLAQVNEGVTITIGAPFASSDLALAAMAIIACIGVPIVLVYHVIVYKVFAGRVDADEFDY